MKRGVWIIISGAIMLAIGHFASQWIVDSIPIVNPSHSSMMSDAQYHMLDWSNQLSIISKWGIIVLVIGIFVAAIDRLRTPSRKNT